MVGGGWQIFFFDFDQNRSLEREDGGWFLNYIRTEACYVCG